MRGATQIRAAWPPGAFSFPRLIPRSRRITITCFGSIDPPVSTWPRSWAPPLPSMLVGAALPGQVVGRDRLEDHPPAAAEVRVIPLGDRRDDAPLPAPELPRRIGRAHGRRAVGVLLDHFPRERTPVEVGDRLDRESRKQGPLLVVAQVLPVH